MYTFTCSIEIPEPSNLSIYSDILAYKGKGQVKFDHNTVLVRYVSVLLLPKVKGNLVNYYFRS